MRAPSASMAIDVEAGLRVLGDGAVECGLMPSRGLSARQRQFGRALDRAPARVDDAHLQRGRERPGRRRRVEGGRRDLRRAGLVGRRDVEGLARRRRVVAGKPEGIARKAVDPRGRASARPRRSPPARRPARRRDSAPTRRSPAVRQGRAPRRRSSGRNRSSRARNPRRGSSSRRAPAASDRCERNLPDAAQGARRQGDGEGKPPAPDVGDLRAADARRRRAA